MQVPVSLTRLRLQLLAFAIAVATAFAVLVGAGAAHAATLVSTLPDGAVLNAGDSVVSASGCFALDMQGDGNLVEYGPTGPIWATGTNGSGASFVGMQGDGNLVEYTPAGRPVWASGTDGHPGAYLAVQDDGNLVIYTTTGQPIWASGTDHGCPRRLVSTLPDGQILNQGDSVVSASGCFTLAMQRDGNLVEYGTTGPIWATGTNGKGASFVGMQGDGNLVMYNAAVVPLWATGTDGHPGSYLAVQDDGNLVVYTPSGQPIWASGTNYGCGNPPPANATAQQLAQRILNSGNIIESPRYPSVLQDLQDAAAGRAATAGHPLSATLLQVILNMSNGHSVTITALESNGTGHAAGSYHYTGDAVDFGALDGVRVTGRNAPSITIINTLARQLPSGSAFGQKNCGSTPALPKGVTTFNDTCNHLHVQVPRNSA